TSSHPAHTPAAGSEETLRRRQPTAWPPDPGIPPNPEAFLYRRSVVAPELVAPARATLSQHETFEKETFRNTAILCDVRGQLVEYTSLIETEDSWKPPEYEMVEAARACRICVVRRRDSLPDGALRFTTSIWAFSDDRQVRLQQKLADGAEIIPFSSYFNPEKISITVPAVLKFHDVTFGAASLKEAKTSWINYIFEDTLSANHFQSILFGRRLLATFRTTSTMRIHDGFAAKLAFQEQMCGMENLRLWEDEESDGVLAMLHFSGHFRNGYLAFWLNSSSMPVRVKEESDRVVRIKGFRISLELNERDREWSGPKYAQGSGLGGTGVLARTAGGERLGGTKEGVKRKASEMGRKGKEEKWITGARVEFASEGEKGRFVALAKEVMMRPSILPDLL
ncbi:hypothetical protein LTS18_005542, partial [Coniosporium uncinatum]